MMKTGIQTQRLFLQRQEDRVEKLHVFEVIINHVVKFESLEWLEMVSEE
jgi:hypothetical protein